MSEMLSTIEIMQNNLYSKHGNFLYIDYLVIFIMTPASVIGFFLNIINFAIFLNKEFKTQLYDYLRIYCVNSAIVNFFSSFNVMYASKRFSALSNTYFVSFFACYIFGVLMPTANFIGSVLDLIISFDRILIFKPKYDLTNFKPKIIFMFVWIFCIIVNSPFYFMHYPENVVLSLNNITIINVYFISGTQFSETIIGKVLTFVIYSIRDVATLLTEIILNIISIILLKKHLNQKSQCRSSKSIQSHTITNHKQFLSLDFNANIILNQRISKISKPDIRATIMVVVLSIISAIVSILLLGVMVSRYNVKDGRSFLYFLGLCGISIKHGMNFFIFYLFNNNFKQNFTNEKFWLIFSYIRNFDVRCYTFGWRLKIKFALL